jgi:hypothetical protein
MLRNGKQREAALELVGRRKAYHPAEIEMIVQAADGLLSERTTYTRAESQLLDIADRLRVVNFTAVERVTSPFDAKVEALDEPLAEAVAALAAARLRIDEVAEKQRAAAADSAALVQQRHFGSTKMTADEFDAAQQRASGIEHGLLQTRAEADADWQIADAQWLRLNSRRLALQLAGDRWRAERELLASRRR